METTQLEPETNKSEKPPIETKKPKGGALRWVVIIIIILLLAGLGFLAWYSWDLQGKVTTLTKDRDAANSKVTTLTKQLDEAKKSTSKQSTTPSTCSPKAASQSLKENIHDAINSGNTAALEGYMASSVKFVLAASEYGPTESAAQATADLLRTQSATRPWNFNIAAATLNTWRAHFYGSYFSATSYSGQAASGEVISFDFDCNGKISQIFMAGNGELLTQ